MVILWRCYAILGIISNMTDTNCCHFTLYMETLEQVSIFTLYRKTLSRLKLFPGRWSVLTCAGVGHIYPFSASTRRLRAIATGSLGWRHAGITTDGSLWAYAMSGDVWDCLVVRSAGAVPLHGPGIVPMDTNGYQWYSWWGIADSQVSPCSVSFVYFVSFASFLIPEVFLAVTERINDSIKLWCLFFLEFSVQAYVRCFPLLAMAVSLMIALRSQCICKTQG